MMHLIHLAAMAGLGLGETVLAQKQNTPISSHVGARAWDLGDGVVQRGGLVHREAW